MIACATYKWKPNKIFGCSLDVQKLDEQYKMLFTHYLIFVELLETLNNEHIYNFQC